MGFPISQENVSKYTAALKVHDNNGENLNVVSSNVTQKAFTKTVQNKQHMKTFIITFSNTFANVEHHF